MYLGFYTSKVTQKNQLTFPSKFTKDTGGRLFVSQWFERSLVILPHDQATQIIQKMLDTTSSLLPEVRDLETFLYTNAEIIELDLKNRFVISKRLRDYAHIQKNAVFLGINDRIEIWDHELYANYSQIREHKIRETAIQLYNRIVNTQKTK